ncbi:ribokinase, partial [Mycobacterium bohemicum]|nr:ribokinase [Mycobacterium bohemicum]
RACAAGALATLVAGAGDCAPDAEAIDAAAARNSSGREQR